MPRAKSSTTSKRRSAGKAAIKRARTDHQAKSAKRSAGSARKSSRRTKRQSKPIDLYYWPTPNGWKISIMLEECRLPYVMHPVNIAKGEQFEPEFLAISPNNRIPAIVDPQGPGGRPISIFESGAILLYLGRKTGKLYPGDERGRVEVEQWLMWQMCGLGPMAGQAHHFRQYAIDACPYSVERYTNECNRLYGVMNKRLADREFLAGKYSIADIACIGWTSRYQRQGQILDDFPYLKRWFETMMARPAVQRGMALVVPEATKVDMRDPQVQKVLFNQRAR